MRDQAQLDGQLPYDHPEKIQFAEFDHWIRSYGAIINKIKPRWENENYRYIVAESDIKKGEDIIAIPHTHWITLEIVNRNSPMCDKLSMHVELASD